MRTPLLSTAPNVIFSQSFVFEILLPLVHCLEANILQRLEQNWLYHGIAISQQQPLHELSLRTLLKDRGIIYHLVYFFVTLTKFLPYANNMLNSLFFMFYWFNFNMFLLNIITIIITPICTGICNVQSPLGIVLSYPCYSCVASWFLIALYISCIWEKQDIRGNFLASSHFVVYGGFNQINGNKINLSSYIFSSYKQQILGTVFNKDNHCSFDFFTS